MPWDCFARSPIDAERVERPETILLTLERCLRKAYRERGPVVVLLPKDVQQAESRLLARRRDTMPIRPPLNFCEKKPD